LRLRRIGSLRGKGSDFRNNSELFATDFTNWEARGAISETTLDAS